MIGIYKITSPSGSVYIGQSNNIEKRFKSYKHKGVIEQPKVFNSFKKYGIDNHKFEIIEVCDLNELNNRENFYITFFNSVKNGMNCNMVAQRGTLCKESRLKLSNSLKETNKNPEVKERRAAWQRGRKMSDESIQKMRLSKLGKKGHPNQIKSAIGNNNAQKLPIQILKDGIVISIAENLYKAAEFVNGDFRNVHRCIKNPKSKHLGYNFKRIE